MFAGGLTQSIGHQRQSPVGKFLSRSVLLGQRIQDRFQSQLLPEMPPPAGLPSPKLRWPRAPGSEPSFFPHLSIAAAKQGRGGQQIFAAEIADHAMARTARIPVRLDEADVLVDGSVGASNFGGAEVHSVTL